jgi:hypothetical protein
MRSAPDDAASLHAAVDEALLPLVRRHAGRLQCRRGCHDCCVDDLTVFEVEAERIRSAYPELLAEGTPGPAGGCAFLDDEGACRIYEARPYVCRTQGLPLRWIDVDERGEAVEYRDICPLNDADDAPPLEQLAADACWELGPIEGRLATLQLAAAPSEPPARVALRALFRSPSVNPCDTNDDAPNA